LILAGEGWILTDIRPFHGVHYNQSLIKDLKGVLCPPYDVITPELQRELYQKNDYNFVRLEFGRELPQDDETDNKYTRASVILNKWINENVLKIDHKPAIYIHDHYFTYLGKQYRRRSIICLVGLEEWDSAVIRPHEGTLSKDKSDRLQILWTLKANTSPVLSLYEDSQKQISSLLETESRSEPFLECNDNDTESHYLWAVTDRDKLSMLNSIFKDKPLYIADGHHRYESALTYRRERRLFSASSPESDGEKPFDFIMMTLVDLDDSGLLILPSHRLIRGISNSMAGNMLNGLKAFFDVSEVTLDRENVRQQVDSLLSEKGSDVRLLLYGLTQERFLLLELSDFERVRAITPYFHSELYQKLNVSIIDHVIMEKLLGISYDTAPEHIAYCSDSVDAINSVNDEYQVAILLNPVKPDVLKDIADSGDRMPRKSTYFYPKIPTGLVFYRFD
jgi:uncharacterized protein (DUF1015 family)